MPESAMVRIRRSVSWSFLLGRLLLTIPALLGVAAVVFVLLRVVPGDPVAMLIGPGATEEAACHRHRADAHESSPLDPRMRRG